MTIRKTMTALIPLLVASLLASTPAACAPNEETVYTSADDPVMNGAIANARASLPVFWAKYDTQAPGYSDFWLKAGLPSKHGGVEHIWIEVTSRIGTMISGRLVNEPVDLKGLRLGSEIKVDPQQISDWIYSKDGKLYGGFTQRAALDKSSPEIRAQLVEALAPTPLEVESH